jgi:hypothetical protein
MMSIIYVREYLHVVWVHGARNTWVKRTRYFIFYFLFLGIWG